MISKKEIDKEMISIVQNDLLQVAEIITDTIIDIEKHVKNSTFFTLQYYFKDELNLQLEFNDLKKMDAKLLSSIDYKKMRRYRGFGKNAELRFKQILESHSIYSFKKTKQ